MKLATADAHGMNSPSSLFASAMTAGVPAAALVTPGWKMSQGQKGGIFE